MKCWCCDYVGDNIGCWAIMVVMVVIEMVVDNKEVYKVGKVVTKVRTKAKSAETGFFLCFSIRDNSSFRLNSLGPLCLWQCFNVRLNISCE